MIDIDKRYIYSFLIGTSFGLIALFSCLAFIFAYLATFKVLFLLGGLLMFAALAYIIITMKKHKAKIDLETKNEKRFEK